MGVVLVTIGVAAGRATTGVTIGFGATRTTDGGGWVRTTTGVVTEETMGADAMGVTTGFTEILGGGIGTMTGGRISVRLFGET
jgi:hypothetical protein